MQTDYDRVASVLLYIEQHFKAQPSLETVAEQVGLSPAHFQRLFTRWAGVSPKKFLQYVTAQHAKELLKKKEDSVLDVSIKTGLSGPGRLHDLFVNIEAMTPGEYKNGGVGLVIKYSFSETLFGTVLIASTEKGVTSITFVEEKETALHGLRLKFPNAQFVKKRDALQENALRLFSRNECRVDPVRLHLRGTEFQLKVWEALLKIPEGNLSTYNRIAKSIGKPAANRAVGSAVGDNPVAFLIPCHRVIQSTGAFGGYHWGTVRKAAMIGWEGAITDN